MDAFIEAFYAIDVDRSETITLDELRNYMEKNNMDPAFIERWQEIFDPEHTGSITLNSFCEVLGLELNNIPLAFVNGDQTKQTSDESFDNMRVDETAPFSALDKGSDDSQKKIMENGSGYGNGYEEISVDIGQELKTAIVHYAIEGLGLHHEDRFSVEMAFQDLTLESHLPIPKLNGMRPKMIKGLKESLLWIFRLDVYIVDRLFRGQLNGIRRALRVSGFDRQAVCRFCRVSLDVRHSCASADAPRVVSAVHIVIRCTEVSASRITRSP
ncbi:dynein light chain [Clonorchis sinensis]|uniref:Dynein light chain n=1 Tax=Clonorchis sinensis TaxID=79923 RepID=G7Y5W1_CLOSI|nr:dynein light chain [Clonorchis sinensis]